MITAEFTIRKIGNSCGAIFSAKILKALNATEPGSKLIICVNDDGSATIRAKESGKSFEGGFREFERYASAWDDPDRSPQQMSEEFRKDWISKKEEIW